MVSSTEQEQELPRASSDNAAHFAPPMPLRTNYPLPPLSPYPMPLRTNYSAPRFFEPSPPSSPYPMALRTNYSVPRFFEPSPPRESTDNVANFVPQMPLSTNYPLSQLFNTAATVNSDTQQNTMRKDLKEYLPLHRAALKGNWEEAKRIFDNDPEAMTASIDLMEATALHTAIRAGKPIHFVEKFIAAMPDDSLGVKDVIEDTALSVAAAVGNIAAATILVERMPDLLYVPNFVGNFPVQIAALYAQRDMLKYLISVTKDDFGQNPYAGSAGLILLIHVIDAEFFDIAIELVEKYPDLARLKLPDGTSALTKIYKEVYFCIIKSIKEMSLLKQQALKLVKRLCKEIELLSFAEANDIYLDAMLIAAQLGIHEVAEEIIEAFPSSIYFVTPNSRQLLIHVAVENRSEHVYNLICQMGAALQMQQEIQWYKEVESYVLPNYREKLNFYNQTSKMVFTEEHRTLKEDAEKWMKDTSNSCTIAAALIVMVMFAAAITVPGGNDSINGYPIFSKNGGFIVFAISDAISLFTSTTSLLMFLAILTSRYAEEDFLYVLPNRLTIGLGTLFLSITFMMAAFGATLYLVFGRKQAWVLIPAAALACLPVTSFVLLQFPLLVELIYSTYGPGVFKKHK
ncbi:hypothetical protein Sango_1964700 [Sesamum angolense]|uniref:PGG domain-containing protein n=1 Tax=Sesamum angolense TaxID=2727404 RepID=A0AAE1WEG1_9LAMI|nr:hypothetical protein Sango_1964700 [Sesamum angolense]